MLPHRFGTIMSANSNYSFIWGKHPSVCLPVHKLVCLDWKLSQSVTLSLSFPAIDWVRIPPPPPLLNIRWNSGTSFMFSSQLPLCFYGQTQGNTHTLIHYSTDGMQWLNQSLIVLHLLWRWLAFLLFVTSLAKNSINLPFSTLINKGNSMH